MKVATTAYSLRDATQKSTCHGRGTHAGAKQQRVMTSRAMDPRLSNVWRGEYTNSGMRHGGRVDCLIVRVQSMFGPRVPDDAG